MEFDLRKEKVIPFLQAMQASRDICEFAIRYQNMRDAWESLASGHGKPEWFVWLATRPGLIAENVLRAVACQIVRTTPLCDGHTVWNLLTDDKSKNAVEVAERFAMGRANDTELDEAWDAAMSVAAPHIHGWKFFGYSFQPSAYAAFAAAEATGAAQASKYAVYARGAPLYEVNLAGIAMTSENTIKIGYDANAAASAAVSAAVSTAVETARSTADTTFLSRRAAAEAAVEAAYAAVPAAAATRSAIEAAILSACELASASRMAPPAEAIRAASMSVMYAAQAVAPAIPWANTSSSDVETEAESKYNKGVRYVLQVVAAHIETAMFIVKTAENAIRTRQIQGPFDSAPWIASKVVEDAASELRNAEGSIIWAASPLSVKIAVKKAEVARADGDATRYAALVTAADVAGQVAWKHCSQLFAGIPNPFEGRGSF